MLIADIGFAADTTIQFITVFPAPVADLGSDMSLCANSSFVFNVGSQDSATYLWQDGSTDSTFLVNQAGTYAVTVTNGCGEATDQVAITSFADIVVELPNDTTICGEEDYLINAFSDAAVSYMWSDGTTNSQLTINSSGTYSVTVSNPCITIADTILINFEAPPTTLDTIPFCQGSSVIFNGVEYFAAAQIFETTPAQVGCDTLNEFRIVELLAPTQTTNFSLCSGDTLFINNRAYTQPGTYLDTVSALVGCDTIKEYLIAAEPNITQTANFSLCSGDTLFINNRAYTQPGTYLDTVSALVGCDTIKEYLIAAEPEITQTTNFFLCADDTLLINDRFYSQPGIYRDTIAAVTGCDTIHEYTITGLTAIRNSITIDTCPGSSIGYEGQNLSAGTTTEVILTSVQGCDSTVTVTVTPVLILTDSVRLSACGGEFATYNGNELAIGSTDEFTFISTAGCDSVVTVTVVEQNDYGEFLGPDTTVCGLEYFLFSPDTATFWTGGTQSSQLGITATGTYTATFQDALGCVITDDIFVEFPLRDTYLPNAFSPNGDGINDCFQPLFPAGLEFLTYNLTIFNRWGAPVYSSTSPQACWNGTFRGKSAQAGVYVWVLESVNAVCRETDSRSGSVTLVR